MTARSFRPHIAALTFATIAGILFPSLAEARSENVRWTHPASGTVQSFEAHVRSPNGQNSQVVAIPFQPSNGNGVFQASIEVGTGTKLISLRAIGNSGERSPWSPPQTREDDTPTGGGGGSTVGPGAPYTATPGAARAFDFDNVSVSSRVSWWLDTSANYSLNFNDALFDVVAIGTNQVFHTAATANNIHSHVTSAENVWSDFEYRGRLAIDDAAASIGVTTYSQFTARDSYYRLGRSAGGAFVLEGRPTPLSCTASTNPVIPQPGSWYRFKLDVQDMGATNQVRAKVWREGTSEPQNYALNCVDSSSQRPTRGRIGVWSAGAGEKYWDNLEVIVGGGGGSSGGGGSGGGDDGPAAPVLIQIVPATP